MSKKTIAVELDNGDVAIVEVDGTDLYEEAGPNKSPFKASSDYIKVVSNVLNNLKNQNLNPDSIELSFNIKLAVTGGKLASWIIADAEAETSLGVTMKWQKGEQEP